MLLGCPVFEDSGMSRQRRLEVHPDRRGQGEDSFRTSEVNPGSLGVSKFAERSEDSLRGLAAISRYKGREILQPLRPVGYRII